MTADRDRETGLAEAREETCEYGHVKADHDAAGACVRPSLDARVAAHAAYPDPLRTAVRIAFERGWDAATVRAVRDGDALRRDLAALAERAERHGYLIDPDDVTALLDGGEGDV